jgi:DNA-binding MarR family transcriptional regulator
MSWHAHKTKSTRKIITLQEWANRLNIKPSSVSHHIKQFEKMGNKYDPKDIDSILDFHRYMIL